MNIVKHPHHDLLAEANRDDERISAKISRGSRRSAPRLTNASTESENLSESRRQRGGGVSQLSQLMPKPEQQ